MTVRPGAEAFHHEGTARVAVLLVHGFTGSPASMRPWGDHLHAHGYTVACPRLPGHGTRWQDMAGTTWQEWYGEVVRHFDELREAYDQVFVCGLSMGGALSLRLAEERGDAISGLVLVNPAVCRPQRLDVPVFMAIDQIGLFGAVSSIMPTVPGVRNDIKKPDQDEIAYEEIPVRSALQLIKLQDTVRGELGKVRQPLLVLSSPEDHVVEPVNAATVMRDVSSPVRTQILLEDSYHVATLDNDAERIFTESVRFIRQYTVGAAEASGDEPAVEPGKPRAPARRRTTAAKPAAPGTRSRTSARSSRTRAAASPDAGASPDAAASVDAPSVDQASGTDA